MEELRIFFCTLDLPVSLHHTSTYVSAVLIVMWGVRLTRNFARKGGYSGEEDYRWTIVRSVAKKRDPFHPLGQEIFSFSFVAVYQTLLIWAFSALPMWQVTCHRSSLNFGDLLVFSIALLALAGETWADEVQFAYQRAKYAMTPAQRAAAGGDYARGFCTGGPFRYSRHLNFFCEQLFWVCMYCFTLSAGAPIVNIGGAGCVALVLLFQGSTWFTELISCGKYPDYYTYQVTTSKLVPWIPGPALDSMEGESLGRQARASRNASKVKASR